jgi:hypothetical protein
MTDIRIQRAAPIAAAVTLVACCCWSHLDGSSGSNPAQALKIVKAVPGTLTVSAEPPAERDPFALPDQQSRPAAMTLVGARRSDELISLRLTGTYLCGKHKLALINDHDYAEGDLIKSNKESADGLLVTAILPDRVLLRRNGRTLELTYSEKSATTAAPAKPAAAAYGGRRQGRAP